MPQPKATNKTGRQPIVSPKNKVSTTSTTNAKKVNDATTSKKDKVNAAMYSTGRSNTAQSKKIYGSNPLRSKAAVKKQVSPIVQETIEQNTIVQDSPIQDIVNTDTNEESDKEDTKNNKPQSIEETTDNTLINDEKISSSSGSDSSSESSSEDESDKGSGSESDSKDTSSQNPSTNEDSDISPVICKDVIEEGTAAILPDEGTIAIPIIVDENKADNSKGPEEHKEVLLHGAVCTDIDKGEIGRSLLLPLSDKQVSTEQGSLIKELKKTMNIVEPDTQTKARVPFNKSLSRLPLTQFIQECSSPGSDTIIFTRQPDNWQFLSNHYMSDMNIDGITYFHVEGYYHAQKFIDNDKAFMHIRSVTAPRIAQIRGAAQIMAPDRQAEWDAGTRIKVMKRGILTKFVTNEALAKKLLATDNKKLIEVTESDSYWGCTADGKGSNMNGKILMQVRSILQYITSNEV